jgi:hypothetical protein
MFGFLRKNSAPAIELSSTAGSASYGVTAVSTDVVTDVAASVASTIASCRVITSWAEPKPFPERPWPTQTVAIWPTDATPLRYPSAEEIAQELFLAMQRQPLCVGKWVLAMSIERVIYPRLCEDLGWPPRSWMGRTGVAAEFAKLVPKAKHFRTDIQGKVFNLQHYFIPHPQTAEVVPLRRS